jgi:hypothetical protein
MEDVTIIIQGRLEQETYDFCIKNYTNCPVIISTWVDCKIDFSNALPNIKIILSPLPAVDGVQNLNYQLVSTLNALDIVNTKYTIKMRGDEFYSYPENIYEFTKLEPNKLHTSPIFFRSWQFAEYHMSDHLISATTENMLTLFKSTKANLESGRLNVSKWKQDGVFKKYVSSHSPEERLTKSYLEVKERDRFEVEDGRILMKEHFQILDINLLKPYKMKANLFKVEFRDNFIPEKNYSISNIDKLFSDDPYKLKEDDTNIA